MLVSYMIISFFFSFLSFFLSFLSFLSFFFLQDLSQLPGMNEQGGGGGGHQQEKERKKINCRKVGGEAEETKTQLCPMHQHNMSYHRGPWF